MEGHPKRNTSMTDVAVRAGVSQMTVSRAIRTPEKVLPSTRAKIDAAMAEFGYTPNLIAGSLAASQSGLVGAVISTFGGAVFEETIAGMSEALEPSGLSVFLGASGYSAKDEERLIRAILGRRPDAMLLTTALHTDEARQLIARAKIPIVEAWELPARPIDMAVGFDNRAAGNGMTLALLDAGYKEVVFVGGSSGGNDPRGVLRREGYRSALESRGLTPREIGADRGPLGIEHGPELLSELRGRFPKADAIFCSFDMLAAGILLAAQRKGIAIPGTLGIAGFGDFAIAKETGLDMTTVRIPSRTIGYRAGEMLLARISGRTVSQKVIDVGYDIIRRSSA